MIKSLVLFGFAIFAHFSFASELETVPKLDLNRYAGKWYEIARLPMKHQDGCIKSEAEYKISGDEIIVTNRCSLTDGKNKEITGIARLKDKSAPAKLEVNFVPGWIRWTGIGWANYWVIEVGDDYQYAVVSEPKREFLWILSRKPSIKKSLYDEITARLSKKGFDLSKLIISGARE